MLTQLITTVGAVGPFSTRTFLPAFLVAGGLRLLVTQDVLAGTPLALLVEVANHEVTWFVSTPFLIFLGVCALVELSASKNPDLRQIINETDPYVKPVVAAVTTSGFLSTSEVQLVQTLMPAEQAGFTAGMLLPLLAAGGTFIAASIRRDVWNVLDEMDPDDSVGFGKFFSWVEEFWVVLLVLLIFVLPVLLLILSAVAMLGAAMLERYFERKAQEDAVPCPQCERPNHPCAILCASCSLELPHPREVGLLGQHRTAVTTDRLELHMALKATRRCGYCATRLARGTKQQCSACAREPFPDEATAEQYINWVAGRQKKVLFRCFLMSLLPVVGFIPGVIYYRLTLVSPYRRYLSRVESLVARWIGRLVSFFIGMWQFLPVVGWFSLPLMAMANHRLFRRAFRGSFRAQFTKAAAGPGRFESLAATIKQRMAAVIPQSVAHHSGKFAVGASVGFATVAVMLVVALLFAGDAEAAVGGPSCPTQQDLIVGDWDWTIVTEEFAPDGNYRIALHMDVPVIDYHPEPVVVSGRYDLTEDGTLKVAIGSSSRSYTAFVTTEDELVYVAENGRATLHHRTSDPPQIPPACLRSTGALTGGWFDAAGDPMSLSSGASGVEHGGVPTARSVTDSALLIPALGPELFALNLAPPDDATQIMLETTNATVYRRNRPELVQPEERAAVPGTQPSVANQPTNPPAEPPPAEAPQEQVSDPPAAAERAEPAAPTTPGAAHAAVNLEWLALERRWSRLVIQKTGCDGGAYDHMQAVDSLTWHPPGGPEVTIRMELRSTDAETGTGVEERLVALGEWQGSGRPRVLMSTDAIHQSSCASAQAKTGFAGNRTDGLLLLSLELLPQRNRDTERSSGTTKRAILRWDAAAGRPASVAHWEGDTREAPQLFRARPAG